MTNHTLQQFHTIAISQKLSAAAILLWQYIYFIAQAEGCYADLCLRTADITQALDITRNGLQKVRRTLVNAGLLQVRIDHRQHVHYTLLLDGKPIDKTYEMTVGAGSARPHNDIINGTASAQKTRKSAPTTTTASATNNDIIHNNAYRKLVDTFCAQYTGHNRSTLETKLLQFLHRRKENGKTLTKAGLDALLDKLVTLAQHNIQTMIDIVNQSINRGWMGFYPCRGRCPQRPAYVGVPKPARIPKYDTKYEDLDYLEW